MTGHTALPARTDVAVIGGGVAGLAVARLLAEGGAGVCLLEARDQLGASESGRDAGLVMLGTVDHPNRLVEAVGTADAAALLRFSARSPAWGDAGALPWKGGGVHAA